MIARLALVLARILYMVAVAVVALAIYTAVSNHHKATAPTTKVASTYTNHMARMVNCEDYDIQPCFTYDEGHWRVVTSYSPYASYTLYKCTEEDGGKRLPCIWKDYNRTDKGQPRTKNVFTK